MRILASKPALRWLAPAVVVGVVATTSLVAATAQADKTLPPIGAEQLLVDLQKSKVDGLSGTVVQEADLGIPAIPGAGGQDSSELTSLISGTHTLRVWYAGGGDVIQPNHVQHRRAQQAGLVRRAGQGPARGPQQPGRDRHHHQRS